MVVVVEDNGPFPPGRLPRPPPPPLGGGATERWMWMVKRRRVLSWSFILEMSWLWLGVTNGLSCYQEENEGSRVHLDRFHCDTTARTDAIFMGYM